MVELTLLLPSTLPPAIAIQPGPLDGNNYLQVEMSSGSPYLTLSAAQRTKDQAHEVVLDFSDEDVFMLRAANGKFWQRNQEGYILADHDSFPRNKSSDPASYFKLWRRSDGYLVLQSLVDKKYLKRYTSRVTSALNVTSDSNEQYCALRISNAVYFTGAPTLAGLTLAGLTLLSPSTLPPVIAIQPDHGNNYLQVEVSSGSPYLTFSAAQRTKDQAHEVVLDSSDEDVFMLRAANGKFWQHNQEGYILADHNSFPRNKSSDPASYFKLWKRSDGYLVLQSLVDKKYLKQYTSGVTSPLSVTSDSDEEYCGLRISNAVDFTGAPTMAGLTLLLPSTLPPVIAIQPDHGYNYLQVEMSSGSPYLTLSADHKTKDQAHEVVLDSSDEDVFMLRAANGKFWQRNEEGYILADRNSFPRNKSSDPASYFRLWKRSDGYLVLQSLVDKKFLKRYTSRVTSALNVTSDSNEEYCALRISDADDFTGAPTMTGLTLLLPSTLPPVIAIQPGPKDGNNYLQVEVSSGSPYLTLSAAQRTKDQAHEVVLDFSDKDVFMLRAANGKFWQRNQEGYILADRNNFPRNKSSDPASYFKLWKRSDGYLVLQSLVDKKYLKRYTSRVTSALNVTSDISERFCALRISNAVAFTGAPSALAASTLPNFVSIQCSPLDNQFHLQVEMANSVPYLTWSATGKSRLTAHQVVLNPSEKEAVMLRAPNGKFWHRNAQGYIVADRETQPGSLSSDGFCYFKFCRRPDGYLCIQSAIDGKWLKRYTDRVTSAVNVTTDYEEQTATIRVHYAVDYTKM